MKYTKFFFIVLILLNSAILFAGNNDLEIILKGNKFTDKEYILSILDEYPNDLTNDKLDIILKKLKDSGHFEDVSIIFDNDTLTINVVEKIKITNLEYIGNKRFKNEQIEEILNHKNYFVYFEINKIEKYIDDLKSLYKSYGYNSIDILYEVEKINNLNENKLLLKIEEGKISKINKINFIGNENFNKRTLLANIKSNERNWLKFYSNSNYKEYVAQNDIIRLKQFYLEQGYKDAEVNFKKEFIDSNNKFNLYYIINENNKFIFNNFNLNFDNIEFTNDILDNLNLILDNFLKNDLKNKDYSSKKLKSLKSLLNDYLFIQGINFFKINILEKNVNNHTVDIIYQIKSTNPSYVKYINIVGNYRTLDEVIRREMVFSEGDAFTDNQIAKSKNNLQKLNLFTKIDINNEKVDIHSHNINVVIDEKQTGEFQFGLSLDSLAGPSFMLGLNESNIGGTGRNVDLGINTSENNTLYKLNVLEPYVFNGDTKLLYGVKYQEEDYSTSLSYKNNTFSSKVGFIFNINNDSQHNINLNYDLKEYIITNSSTVSDSIAESSGEVAEISLINTFSKNKLNSFLLPTDGYYFSYENILSPQTSSKGGHIKNSILYRKYFNYGINTFSLQSKLGNVFSISNSEILNDKKYSLGGKWLRGFDIYGAGPRNSITSYVGGNNLFITKLDFIRPINKFSDNPINLNLFSDIGKVWGNKNDPTKSSESIRASYGFGLKIYSPIGPIGFSWGYPLMDESYDVKRMFLFSIGNID